MKDEDITKLNSSLEKLNNNLKINNTLKYISFVYGEVEIKKLTDEYAAMEETIQNLCYDLRKVTDTGSQSEVKTAFDNLEKPQRQRDEFEIKHPLILEIFEYFRRKNKPM